MPIYRGITSSSQHHAGQREQQISLNGFKPCVMNLPTVFPCSATLGKIAALQKEVIASFPGPSNKQKDVWPGVKPAG